MSLLGGEGTATRKLFHMGVPPGIGVSSHIYFIAVKHTGRHRSILCLFWFGFLLYLNVFFYNSINTVDPPLRSLIVQFRIPRSF